MKNNIPILICILLLSCNNKKGKDSPSNEDTIAINYSWEAALNDSTGKLEMKKTVQPGLDTITTETVIQLLNTRYPNVQVKFLKQSGDTLYLSIPEATYLTQQMGSTGPELYFADAVYNLTSVTGIRFVSFDFEEGDHAAPDVLNRESFRDK